MGYIEEIRSLVGDRPLIMVGATALILDENGRLLMMRRTDNACWGVPGGAMEPGESLEETLRRETWEETGLEIVQMALHGVFSGRELYYQYPNGDQVYVVTAVYLIPQVRGDIQINRDEHSEWQYFDIHDLPEDISPPIKPILKSYISPSLPRQYDH